MNNFENMKKRIEFRGGALQQERMIKDKRETLDRVVYYSYQGADVKAVGDNVSYKALINPNKLKQDYDDKVISIGFESGFKPGTVFEWQRTETKWLIYLQDLTELAYFRGDIRKCSYEISWKDESGQVQTTYAAVRGPVETKINFIQKNKISIDEPNHSLDILLPKTKETLEYFRRYSKFYLQGLDDGDINICWRVEATDSISMPGVLEIIAVEYYSNLEEDDLDPKIPRGKVIEDSDPNEDVLILGDTFIKPKVTYTYTYTGTETAEWSYDKTLPLIVKINEKSIDLKWDKSYTGQFELNYGTANKTIVVESLF